MKILVVSKKASLPEYQWKFVSLSGRPEIQIRVIPPSFYKDFKEGFKFYPDIIWVDDEPYSAEVSKWLILKQFFMPWSRVVATANDNFYRQFSGFNKWFEKFNFRNLSGILSNGRTITDNLLRKGYSGKIAEIPGISSIRHSGQITDDSDPASLKGSLGLQFKTVGYMGSLREEKGLEWLLRSVAKVPINLSLLFVGKGPLEFRLRKLSAELGMESRLKIIPDVERREFKKFYRAMDVMVLPSLSTLSWREPFDPVLIEAMSVGLPVVASRSGEIPNEVGDGAVLIPEKDQAALTEALSKILNDEAFRTGLIQKGKERAEFYNPKKMIDELVNFFSTIQG